MPIPILVVDDEPNFLQMVKTTLGKRGFEVSTALNLPDAVKLAGKDALDFALLDIRLGPDDGITCLEQIKKIQPKIRAIMITAYPTEETRILAREKGASGYLVKPLELKEPLQAFTSAPNH